MILPRISCPLAMRAGLRLAAVVSCTTLVLACGDDHSHADDHAHDGGHEHQHALGGEHSGAICPSDSQLTYDNFGKAFMQEYCTACHDSSLTGLARLDAPLDHDFETIDGVRFWADHIDEVAAAGPDAVNTLMPPAGLSQPTQAEREQLGEWLACGAP